MAALGLTDAERDVLVGLPQLRGGREVLDRADTPGLEACAPCTICSPSAAWQSA